MKKKILSDDAYHSVWLQVGITKLRSLKAGKLTGKRTMAFDEAEIPGRQSSDLVIVEVRATDSETSDEVKVTQIPPSMYFGFGAQVEMRCKCRGVILAETAAPAAPTARFRIIQSGRVTVIEVSIVDHKGNVVNVIQGTQTIVGGEAPDYTGASVTINGLPFIYTPPGVASAIPGVPFEFQLASGVITNLNQLNEVRSGAASEVSPTYLSLVEAAKADSTQRSAVFLTDGTELVSVPTNNTTPTTYPHTNFNTLRTGMNWNGGDTQATFDVYYEGNGIPLVFTRNDNLKFTVPDDACYQKVSAPGYPGVADINTSAAAIQWAADWNAFQAVALEREHKRRKKCSDGQMAYLRNGFMSPEIERFVKGYHPVSNLLRRDIPMQIISEPDHTLVNEEYDSDGERIAATYECRLTLMYIVDSTEHQKEFIGQVRFTEFTATYTNYPLLGLFLNGAATPVYDEFRAAYDLIHVEMMYWIYRIAAIGIVHDGGSKSLFCEVNGTFTINNRWYDEFYDSGPTPSIGYFPGETVKTSFAGLTLAYPQFLLDYIAASKPIETEIDENGNKVPVTPSTDWLSSRLTDKEVIKVIPLNHVGNSYGNYGMFPLMQLDTEGNLIVNELRIYGYAEFQYSAETTSFTFKKWVEFIEGGTLTIKIDDEVTMDDELEPTTITVVSGGATKTYNLAPKTIPYDEAWGAANCVGIASKVKWSDLKAQYKDQKKRIAESFEPEAPDELTPEEALYAAVKKAIT